MDRWSALAKLDWSQQQSGLKSEVRTRQLQARLGRSPSLVRASTADRAASRSRDGAELPVPMAYYKLRQQPLRCRENFMRLKAYVDSRIASVAGDWRTTESRTGEVTGSLHATLPTGVRLLPFRHRRAQGQHVTRDRAHQTRGATGSPSDAVTENGFRCW